MFTQRYKGWFIHGYFDKARCTVQHPRGFYTVSVKSIHAAKLRITKEITQQYDSSSQVPFNHYA